MNDFKHTDWNKDINHSLWFEPESRASHSSVPTSKGSSIKKRRQRKRTDCESWWTLAKLTFIIIASWCAISGGCAKGRADDAIWNADGSYAGHTTDNGSYYSVWGVNGAYKGHIDKDWINPYVPKIDRGRE
jgi:hypothetical protein